MGGATKFMTDATVTPFPVNEPAKIVNLAVDGLVTIVTDLVIADLDIAAPIFTAPVIDVLTDDVIKALFHAFYKKLAIYLTFGIVAIEVGMELNDEQKALIQLKATQLQGDPNATLLALQAFGKTVGALTHIDGSFNPDT